MLVRIKKPLAGFAYFVNDSFDMDDKIAEAFIKSGHIEKIEPPIQKVIAPQLEKQKVKTR